MKTICSKKHLLLVIASFLLASAVYADPVKLRIQKDDQRSPGGSGTGLDRGRDVNHGGDVFETPQTGPREQFDPPDGFAAPLMDAPPPPPPPANVFQRSIEQEGVGDFDGQSQHATPAQPAPQQPFNLHEQTQGSGDSEEMGQMKLLWDEWHRRVAEAIFLRFSTLADAAFPGSRPMLASASYTVTRDGHIVGAQMQQKNQNPIFNAIVLTAINSLNGQTAILQFPRGSRRQSMFQSGNFTQNYGPNKGYKHQIHDFETQETGPQPH